MADSFDVVVGTNKTTYNNAKEAGAAYFNADITQRPAVIHSMEGLGPGGSARFMAETEIHGQNEDGSNRFVKALPSSDKAVDKEFRAGYTEALEKSKEADKNAAEIASRGPTYGVMTLDDKTVTSIRFERAEKDGQEAFDVSFHLGNKTVGRLKGIDADSLKEAVGEKNAKAITEHGEVKGSLKGESLMNEYGLSPEEAARRDAMKEAQASHDLEPDDPAEQNIVSHEPERLEEIDVEEGLARLARHRAAERRIEEERAAEREQRDRKEQKELADNAEGKRIKVENLSEKAVEQDNINRLAEHNGNDPSYNDQMQTEREKNRQIELMDQVHNQFRVAGSKFHFKDQPQRIAFKDKGERMVSASNDDRVAHAMATMAEAKGWKTIRVSGHPEFKKEVWMEASLRGLQVRGFEPKEQDLKELEARLDKRSRNTVEREPEKEQKQARQKLVEAHKEERQATTQDKPAEAAKTALRAYAGRVIEHGEAPFNHDPKEKKNYFVKMATAKGEETVWGVDLKRGMTENKVKSGDEVRLEFQGKQPVTVTALERDKSGKVIGTKEIETNRNTWDVQKSDRAKVVGAVAAEMMKGKGLSEQEQQTVMKAINERLEQREKQGKVPAVPMYDKKAPSAQRQAERTRPQVEHNAERTR
jgi:putative DNA primase/helicase